MSSLRKHRGNKVGERFIPKNEFEERELNFFRTANCLSSALVSGATRWFSGVIACKHSLTSRAVSRLIVCLRARLLHRFTRYALLISSCKHPPHRARYVMCLRGDDMHRARSEGQKRNKTGRARKMSDTREQLISFHEMGETSSPIALSHRCCRALFKGTRGDARESLGESWNHTESWDGIKFNIHIFKNPSRI